ncbi:T9SS type A sorting domain-containing protein [bacterium]|nr:T9SS type A sorting domain-containing protein [bacterium]
MLAFLILPAAFLDAEENHPVHERGLRIPPEVREYWRGREPLFKPSPDRLQASMDWSSQDSPVKNQRSCGSCWAFSAIGLVENIGAQTDLSEQVIISCADGGCSGGWYGDALQYIAEQGVPPESCYPYTAANGSCGNQCSNPAFLEKIETYDYWPRWGDPDLTTAGRLKTLLQSGPVIVTMLVPDDGTFDDYDGGIYDYSGGAVPEENGHAVLVVGYNDSGSWFKVKNSWGTGWGENGYFRISYNDVTDDIRFGGYACTASNPFTEEQEVETLSAPGKPSGDTSVLKNTSHTYSTTAAVSSLGHVVEYRFEWGDGTYSAWSASLSASHSWSAAGIKTVYAHARCSLHPDVTSQSSGLAVTVNEPVETVTTPGTPSGEASPTRGQTYTYSTTGAVSSLGHTLEYRFDWGDGTFSFWSVSKSQTHVWNSTGPKNVRVEARCMIHTDKSNVSGILTVQVLEPETVSKPGMPSGPARPTIGILYPYTFTPAVSNLGHELEYRVSWGDGALSDWSAAKSAEHAFVETGTYLVTVHARCRIHPDKTSSSDPLTVIAEEPERLSEPLAAEGEKNPVRGTACEYRSGGAISNLGHPVEYSFDWGDSTSSDWTPEARASHAWAGAGDKAIVVTARCRDHPDKQSVSGTAWIRVLAPFHEIRIRTRPESLSVAVDDTLYHSPAGIWRRPGDRIHIRIPSPQGFYAFESIEGKNQADSVFTLGESDTCIQALFRLMQFPLSIASADTAMGRVAPCGDSLPVYAGTFVRIQAFSRPGFAFSAWSGDLAGERNPDSLFMDGAKSVTAHFYERDFSPPALITFPAPGSRAVPIDEPVRITLTDPGHAPDPDSLDLFLNGIPLILDGTRQTWNGGCILLGSDTLRILLLPRDGHSAGATTVRLRCLDSSRERNILDSTWSFEAGSASTRSLGFHEAGAAGVLEDTESGIRLWFPQDDAQASGETVFLQAAENIPALPDTVRLERPAWHFSPHGIIFRDSIRTEVRVDSGSAAETDGESCYLFYLAPQRTDWQMIGGFRGNPACTVSLQSLGYLAVVRRAPETLAALTRPAGPTELWKDSLYAFSIPTVQTRFGSAVEYSFSWGTGNSPAWSPDTSAFHTWSLPGRYGVTVTARLVLDPDQSVVSDTLFVTVGNSHCETATAAALPDRFDLLPGMPNPFNPRTVFTLTLPSEEWTDLIIYNMQGQRVKVLASGRLAAGIHRFEWDGSDGSRVQASGLYICVMRAGSFVRQRKVMFLK